MNVLIYITPSPPEVMRFEYRGLPLGPLTIGTYVKHAGHSVKIIDGNIYKSPSDFEGFVPDVLGISMLTMYGILDAEGIRGFIADVRTVAAPVVVFGGPGSSVLSEVLLSEKLADYIVLGPGEEVFVDLLAALENASAIHEIPGIAYLDDGVYRRTAHVVSGGFGMPLSLDYSLMDMPRYIAYSHEGTRSMDMCTSRGCKYRCAFCFNEFFYACSYQPRPVSTIIAEMKFLIETYGVTYFRIMDECFGSDKAWLHELCNAMIAELPPIIWWCQLRGGMNNREDYELMFRAGCRTVFIGVESADPEMSRKIRKSLNLKRLPAEIDMLHELGFMVTGSFIVGFPGETREQLRHTCEFMLASKINSFYMSKFYLIPNTGAFEELLQSGRVTMPETLAEFQAFLSPKRYRNYANVPERELDAVIAFFSLAYRLELLAGKGAVVRVRSFIKSLSQGGGGDKRYLFYIIALFMKTLWRVFAHPFIRKKYGLTFRNFQRYNPTRTQAKNNP